MRQESQESPPAAAECPPLEELACLVDGVLSPEDSEVTLGHILACPKCYELYIGLLRFQLAHPNKGLEQTKGKALPLPAPPPPMSSSGDTNIRWGKWRPAAAAKRLGPVAHSLERLLFREGFTFDEASEVLRTRYGVEASREKLEAYYRALPRRTRRQLVGEESLQTTASPEPSPEEAAMAREGASRRAEVLSFLQEAVHSLPADERLFVRLYFEDGLRIADIARAQKVEQKPLYRHREKILGFLREYLRDRGVSEDEIASLLSVGDRGGRGDSGGD